MVVTGESGITVVTEDFIDGPNVKEETVAANNLSEQPAKPDPKKEPPKQLLRIAKQPTPAIQNDRMSAHFIGFRAHRLKNRTRVVTMRFSLDLEDGHSGWLPDKVEAQWKHFKRGGVKLTQPEDIETQHVSISIAPDQSPFTFTADVPKVVLTHVVEKGKGNARLVIRLEIHLLTTYTADIAEFCRATSDETVWLQLEKSQDPLFDDEDDEE